MSSTRPGASVTADPGASERPVVHRYLPLALGVGAVVLLVDQLTKWWALSTLDDRTIDVVWTLRFNLVFNRAAAFSLGDGMGPFIGVLALVVVGILLWTGRSIGSRLGAVGLGMVLGGALGNILDRAFRSGDGFLGGAVIDFIDMQWWPVFNIADMGVVVGAALLFIGTMGEESPDDAEGDDPALELEGGIDGGAAAGGRPDTVDADTSQSVDLP